MWPDQADRYLIKIGLSVVALVVLVGVVALRRGTLSARARRALDASLVVLALASVFAYAEFGWLRFGRYMNPHDVYHYYLGAKYSQEHHYTNLYRCALIVDQESGDTRFKGDKIRNLSTHKMERVADVMAKRGPWCTDAFSTERWREFSSDVRWFRDMVPAKKWTHMLSDKGYNATPVWNATARFLANRSPTSDEGSMLALTLIDPILLALAFTVVFATFGWRIGALALIYYGLAYWMSHVHIKGGFLRLDWVACMLMAMAALHRKRHGLAGALLAWATMARVFPLLFAAGLGMKALLDLAEWWKARRAGTPQPLARERLVFFAAFGGTVALLVGLSAFADGGFHLWREFVHKIGVHDADISSTRVGFKYLWLIASRDKAADFAQTAWLYWPIALAAVVASMWAMRRLRDELALAFGVLPFFFLAAPTFYYEVVLVVPFLGFAATLELRRMWWAAAGLFGMSVLLYVLDLKAEEATVFVVASPLLFAFCALLWAVLRQAHEPVQLDGVPPAAPPYEVPPALVRWIVVAASAATAVSFVVLFGVRPALVAARAPTVERVPLEESLAPEEREIILGGDVMLSRNVARSVETNQRSFGYPFAVIRPLLERADLAMANLECPISGRGEKVEKLHVFNAPPKAIEGVIESGLDVVTLANNHLLDFGPVALADTEAALAGTAVKSLGITDGDDPQQPVIIDARGVRVGVLAYCDPESDYGCAKEFAVFPRGPARAFDHVLERDLAALRPQVDVLVVAMHWGKEYRQVHNERQTELGRRLIDLGADIVAGHHPHVQQTSEVYRDRLIIYSMGNLVFDQRSRADTRESRLYRVIVDKKGLVRVSYWPLAIALDDWQPRPTDDKGLVLVHRLR